MCHGPNLATIRLQGDYSRVHFEVTSETILLGFIGVLLAFCTWALRRFVKDQDDTRKEVIPKMMENFATAQKDSADSLLKISNKFTEDLKEANKLMRDDFKNFTDLFRNELSEIKRDFGGFKETVSTLSTNVAGLTQQMKDGEKSFSAKHEWLHELHLKLEKEVFRLRDWRHEFDNLETPELLRRQIKARTASKRAAAKASRD